MLIQQSALLNTKEVKSEWRRGKVLVHLLQEILQNFRVRKILWKLFKVEVVQGFKLVLDLQLGP